MCLEITPFYRLTLERVAGCMVVARFRYREGPTPQLEWAEGTVACLRVSQRGLPPALTRRVPCSGDFRCLCPAPSSPSCSLTLTLPSGSIPAGDTALPAQLLRGLAGPSPAWLQSDLGFVPSTAAPATATFTQQRSQR